MKKIILGILVVTITLTSFAQKPKKTHDAQKFMKKVQFTFVPEYIHKWMPDDAALQYISEKSGQSLDELKAANKTNLETIKKAITDINALGLVYVWDNAEVKVKQESPVKIADILVHCHAKDKKFVFNLTNCVQTNLSWYLGDNIIPEGEGFEATIAAKEDKPKKPGGLLGKMNDLNEGMKDAGTKAQIQLAAQQMITDSINDYRPGYEAKHQSFKFDEAKKNVLMSGYYVNKDGSIHSTFIPYQKPEFLFGELAQGFDLLTYQGGKNSVADVFNATTDPNFDKFIKKNQLKAFYLNGNLYKVHGIYGWGIVLNEGAIHSFLTVVKLEVNGKPSYQIFKQTQKLDGEAFGGPYTPISEKNLLKMMEDAPEIIQQYKDGKLTLNQAEVEYNIWYDKEYPNKVDYLFGVDGKK